MLAHMVAADHAAGAAYDGQARSLAPRSGTATGLGIVVVHHTAPADVLDDAMRRVRDAAPRAAVVLVATGARPPTPGEGWPRGLQVRRAANRSYAHAVNIGLAGLTGSRFLALMNDDVLVRPSTFTDMIAALRSAPGAGLAGPVALDRSGRPQDLGIPYRLAYARARAGSAATNVAWLSGCLIVMTREAYCATGGFDETFRFTNEDIDLCLRARRLGYGSLLVPTQVVHLGGSSTPAHPAFHVEGRRGGYLVTARHLPRTLAPLHRAYLVLEGTVGAALSPTANRRRAHRQVAAMAAEASWDTAPFGPSLDDR